MSTATRSQWQFPRNEADKVLGWRSDGTGMENKDWVDPASKQDANANLTAIANGDAPGTTGLAILTDEDNVDVERRLRYNSMKRPRDYAIGLGFAYSDLENGNAAADRACLQALLDDHALNEGRLYDWNGDWSLDQGLNVGPASGAIASVVLQGQARFSATTAIANMLTMRNCGWLNITHEIQGIGTGGTDYSTRTCDNFIRAQNSGRMKLPVIRTENFRGFAYVQKWVSGQNNNLNHIDKIFCRVMGSGWGDVIAAPDLAQNLSATFSGRTDPVTADNNTQRTRLSGVSAFPPTGVLDELATGLVGLLVEINGHRRIVMAYDTGAGTIDLYPRLTPFATTSGTLTWIFGGAWHASGADSNNLSIDNIDAQSCGIIHGDHALYGARIGSQTTTTSKVLWCVGRGLASASPGGEQSAFYAETDSPVVCVSMSAAGAGQYFRSLETTRGPLETHKFDNLSLPIANATELPLLTQAGWRGFDFQVNGIKHSYEKRPRNADPTFGSFVVDIGDPRPYGEYIEAAKTIQLVAPYAGMNDLNGRDHRPICIMGNGVKGAPGGAVTFAAPTAGPITGTSITNPGSGGTPGTYNLRIAHMVGGGGGKGTFDVDGAGELVSITMETGGLYPIAPTLIFTECPGLTGATATATITAATVNGGSTAVFTHFDGPGAFHAYWKVATNAYQVLHVNSPLQTAVALADAATIATNLALGRLFEVTLTANRTMGLPTNLSSAAGKKVRWKVNTGAGGFTLAWNAAFKWAGGAAPTLTTTASRYDIFEGEVNQAGTAIDMIVIGQDYTP